MLAPLIRFGHTIFAGPIPKTDPIKIDNEPLELSLSPGLGPIESTPKQTDNPVIFRGIFRPNAIQLANQVILGSDSSVPNDSNFDAAAAAHELFIKSKLELSHSDNAQQLFSQLLTLRETPVIMRLMTSKLMAEILQNRHQYPTIDSIADIIKKRHGEVSLGFFGKTKLLLALQPFLGKKDFFILLIKSLAAITGLPEGVIALEILSFFFKMGHTSPAVKTILENFLKLLKVTF